MPPLPYNKNSSAQEDVQPFPRPRKSSNASVISEGSPASLKRQRQTMKSFEGSSSSLSLPLLFIKDRLQWTVFSAEYKERRYMDFLKSYRDVLVIDKAEKEVIKVFKEVIKHCKKEMDENVWIGITKSPDGVTLYVELPEERLFGHYWFLVRSVKYRSSHGLDMRIRCLREVCQSDSESVDPSAPATRPVSEWSRDDLLRWVSTHLSTLPWGDALSLFRQVFSMNTVREMVRFLSVCVVLLASLFKDAPVWLLRFMDAAGVFVQRCTPLTTALLQFCLKVVGGLYILLARMWTDLRRGSPPVPPPPMPQRRLQYVPYAQHEFHHMPPDGSG